MNPFYWQEYDLDLECAQDLGLETVEELYNLMSEERNRR